MSFPSGNWASSANTHTHTYKHSFFPASTTARRCRSLSSHWNSLATRHIFTCGSQTNNGKIIQSRFCAFSILHSIFGLAYGISAEYICVIQTVLWQENKFIWFEYCWQLNIPVLHYSCEFSWQLRTWLYSGIGEPYDERQVISLRQFRVYINPIHFWCLLQGLNLLSPVIVFNWRVLREIPC